MRQVRPPEKDASQSDLNNRREEEGDDIYSDLSSIVARMMDGRESKELAVLAYLSEVQQVAQV